MDEGTGEHNLSIHPAGSVCLDNSNTARFMVRSHKDKYPMLKPQSVGCMVEVKQDQQSCNIWGHKRRYQEIKQDR